MNKDNIRDGNSITTQEESVEGYDIGNLTITIQMIPQKGTTKQVKAAFCTLRVRNNNYATPKNEEINFIFALNSVPSFRKNIESMVNEAISKKIAQDKKIKKTIPKKYLKKKEEDNKKEE